MATPIPIKVKTVNGRRVRILENDILRVEFQDGTIGTPKIEILVGGAPNDIFKITTVSETQTIADWIELNRERVASNSAIRERFSAINDWVDHVWVTP